VTTHHHYFGMATNSLTPASSAVPAITTVENAEVQEGYLSWSQCPAEDRMALDSILLIVKETGDETKQSGYFISGLKENAEDPEMPFKLVLLRTTSLPPALLQRHQISSVPTHLTINEKNKVDVIVSVKSGTSLALKFWDNVLQPLLGLVRRELYESSDGLTAVKDAPPPDVLITQSAESVAEFARSMLPSEGAGSRETATSSRTIILLSGDGGVVDLLNGCDGISPGQTRPLVALIPLGTANALFHSLHKPIYTSHEPGSSSSPTPLVVALRTLLQGAPADLPVFRASFSSGSHIVAPTVDNENVSSANEQPEKKETGAGRVVSHLNGAIVASYGFHASLVYESDTPAYRVHGSKRFGMVAQELLRESHPYTAQVAIRRPGTAADAFEVVPRDAHTYVLSTVVSNLERTFTISPASRPLDGKLRLVHFGPVGGERTMKAMMAAYDEGKHVDIVWEDGQRVGYDEVEEVRVVIQEEGERWRKVCVDGTIVEVPKGGSMTVRTLEEGPLRVLVNPSILDR
jgi:diacylglycerol kinase family enzyme